MGGSIAQTAEPKNLEVLQEFLNDCAIKFGLERRRASLLSVALEEIFINICHYAYPHGPGPVDLSCHSEGDRLIVQIMDEGQPFDVSAVSPPDLEADLESRKIGGLGWFIVRKAVDDLHCYREGSHNIVRMTLRR